MVGGEDGLGEPIESADDRVGADARPGDGAGKRGDDGRLVGGVGICSGDSGRGVDGDLDERRRGRGVWVSLLIMSQSPLDQSFQIGRAGCISVEAVHEGVIQIVQMKVPSATRIGSIQKRTVLAALR